MEKSKYLIAAVKNVLWDRPFFGKFQAILSITLKRNNIKYENSTFVNKWLWLGKIKERSII